MTIRASYTPTAGLLFQATRHSQYVTRTSLMAYGFISGLPLLLILIGWLGGWSLSNPNILGMPLWIAMLTIAIGAPLLLLFTQYLAIRGNLRSNPSAQQRQNYSFTEKGFEITGDGINVAIDWNKVVRVVHTSKFLLLFFSRRTAYFVPVELLEPGDIETIQGWHRNAD